MTYSNPFQERQVNEAFEAAKAEALKQIDALTKMVNGKGRSWGEIGDLNHIAHVIREHFTEVV